MKNFLKDNWFKIGILLVLIIIALSIAYYFVVYIPKSSAEKSAEQSIKSYNLTVDLNACLDKANTDYWAFVNLNGTKKADGSIWATNDIWSRADKNKQNAIDNCYKQFPQN